MMRVVKSVSLPVELAEKASKLPNFSVFIQEALQYEGDAEEARQKHLAAAKRRIAVREAALYRILKLNWSARARRDIIAILDECGIFVEELEDF